MNAKNENSMPSRFLRERDDTDRSRWVNSMFDKERYSLKRKSNSSFQNPFSILYKYIRDSAMKIALTIVELQFESKILFALGFFLWLFV